MIEGLSLLYFWDEYYKEYLFLIMLCWGEWVI